MARYLVGQIATLTGTFRDELDALTSPTTVTLSVRKPNGTTVTPATSTASTGVYTADVTLDQAGVWFYTFTGTGALDAIQQGTLVVRKAWADLLAPTEFRSHAESSLDDDAIQRLLDAAADTIDAHLGPVGTRTETITGGRGHIYLLRPVSSVTSVTETVGTTTTTLATTDYLLRGNRHLQRLSTGTNSSSYWRGRVTVTYAPADDVAERIRVQVGLVKLDLAFNGYQSQSIGDYSESQAPGDYWTQRRMLLNSLTPNPVIFA